MWTDDNLLALSGVQHFVFCPRQWALIHLEQQWFENEHTKDGSFVHGRCHDSSIREKRGDVLVVRGLYVVSHALGLSGICDVVEFHACDDGVELANEAGKYRPIPVEYKRGKRKIGDEDRAQVCAQAIALEEMFGIDIPVGYLFYDAEKHREEIPINDALREKTAVAVDEMHKCFVRGYTPRPKRKRSCTSCSLIDACAPNLSDAVSVKTYINEVISDLII